jgi:glycosyltransferase involved in cell wall biosynthesis
MRIFIDTDCLYLAKTGVKTYVKELISALREEGAEVIELKRNSNSFSVQYQDKNKLVLHGARIIWSQFILPLKLLTRRKKGDILISPEYFTPFICPIPNMVTVHDAVFETQKENYSFIFQKTLQYIVWPSVRKASRVLTVSNDAKQQISERININEDRINVTYLGVKSKFSAKYNTGESKGPFFLYVGVMEKRKNLLRAIEAFQTVKEKYTDLKFYIVGQPAPFQHLDDSNNIKVLINKLKLEDSVQLLGYVDDDELASLYSNAFALIFISTYEGFGLPIIEGFSTGIPVLTSKGGATEEVAGNGALLCDPYNIKEISNCMFALYEDRNLRDKLILLGKERAKNFSWNKMARQIIEIGRKLH